MGAGPSLAMQAAMEAEPHASDAAVTEETEAHDVRRLRWILRVANNPESCEEWYLGDERDGVRHGQGAAFYTSGDVYNGQWYRGAWHGKGSLTHTSGAKYSGMFEKGQRHGNGEFTDEDGVRFGGEFRRGRRHGAGFMVSPSGAKFEGYFRDDLANGDGILTWPDGGKFIGKYSAGKENGRGVILDQSGSRVCEVECAAGVLVGGRTVCPGSLGGGKGPKCRGGSQSCGFCLETALDLELSISHDEPDALHGLSAGGSARTRTGSGAAPSRSSRALSTGSRGAREGSSGNWAERFGSGIGGGGGGGGGWGGGDEGHMEHRCVVRVKPRPYYAPNDTRGGGPRGGGSSGGGEAGQGRS